jgi:sorbitol-6-phosphate 2-dehydrogenase
MADIHGGEGKHEGNSHYHFWPTDISSTGDVTNTVSEIIQRFGRIDGLVNNAGVNFRACSWMKKPRLENMN